jgi:ABC-type transporter MlaC component
MKRILVFVFASLLMLCNWAVASPAHAQSLLSASTAATSVDTKAKIDFLEQVRTQLLPQLESILTPEQQAQLEAAMTEGKASFRKAFKSMLLTPEQKTQLATAFKSLPNAEAFSAMTPEQKMQLFMKKKEMFMPTPEEISQKISDGMKNQETKNKEGFIPSPEEISQRISAGMKMIKNKMED